MFWYLTEPLNAGVFHGGIGVEALGDSVGDDGLALFVEQLDQPLLLRDQRVDACGFAIKKPDDGFYL